MYKIIGTDGKEYGPVTAEQLRQWMAEGRVNAQTKVWKESSGEWQPLSSFPELAAPPSLTASASRPQPKTSRLAVTSLVLGCLGLVTCGLTALPGLILGIVGLVKINRSGGRLGGNGLAIAGICVSGMMLLLIPIQAAMLLPALSSTREKARRVQCTNNLKQLGLALAMNADQADGKLPAADSWCDALTNYVSSTKIHRCPSSKGEEYTYAFNRNLSNGKWQDEEDIVLLMDCDQGLKNHTISGPSELGPSPHRQGYNVLFNDGHVEFVSKERLSQLQWKPKEKSK